MKELLFRAENERNRFRRGNTVFESDPAASLTLISVSARDRPRECAIKPNRRLLFSRENPLKRSRIVSGAGSLSPADLDGERIRNFVALILICTADRKGEGG